MRIILIFGCRSFFTGCKIKIPNLVSGELRVPLDGIGIHMPGHRMYRQSIVQHDRIVIQGVQVTNLFFRLQPGCRIQLRTVIKRQPVYGGTVGIINIIALDRKRDPRRTHVRLDMICR